MLHTFTFFLSYLNSLTLLTIQSIIMKNFGSILTLLAISASVVSGRALPGAEDGLQARGPLAMGEYLADIEEASLTSTSLRSFRSFTKEEQGCW